MLTALAWIGIVGLACLGLLLELCLRAPTIEDMDTDLPEPEDARGSQIDPAGGDQESPPRRVPQGSAGSSSG